MKDNMTVEETAIFYAERGLSVILVDPKTKAALHKFKDQAPLTPEEVKDKFARFPNAGLALRTDKFAVIDVDKHHGDGVKSLDKLGIEDCFKHTLFEQTPTGGYHFFFYQPKVRLKQDIGIWPDVDLKIGYNSYVVISPTPGYKILNRTNVKEFPEELLDIILKKQADKAPETSKLDMIEQTFLKYQRTPSENTVKMFNMLLNGLGTEGIRNNNLAFLAGSLLARNLEPELVIDLCLATNQRGEKPLPEDEAFSTIASILRKHAESKKVWKVDR